MWLFMQPSKFSQEFIQIHLNHKIKINRSHKQISQNMLQFEISGKKVQNNIIMSNLIIQKHESPKKTRIVIMLQRLESIVT